MSAPFKKIYRAAKEFILKKIFKRRHKKHVVVSRQIHSLDRISPEKREKLQKLCEQLLKHKSFITSGRLQFIGLEAVRKKLGRQWPGLAKVVYEIVETVMTEHLDPDDLYIRSRDDAYTLIFARSDLIAGQVKASAIAEGIREKLFSLDEDDLKSIELREAVKQIKMNVSAAGDFPDFLDELTAGWDEPESEWTADEEIVEKTLPADVIEDDSVVPIQEVETAAYRLRPAPVRLEAIDGLVSKYLPLWDVSRGALTTYLCLLQSTENASEAVIEGHVSLYRDQPRDRVLMLDMHILKDVMKELAAMAEDGRKLLIACPVHYDTLYSFESYEEYKVLLAEIPEEHKPFLVFYVMGVSEALPTKDPFWFGVPLQQFCRHVILELPLRRDAPFSILRGAGIKNISVCIEQSTGSEQETIKLLNYFSQRADSFQMGTIGLLGVPSLSITTSSICAGFGLLGGKAIHELVQKPESIHRYKQEDLLKALSPQA